MPNNAEQSGGAAKRPRRKKPAAKATSTPEVIDDGVVEPVRASRNVRASALGNLVSTVRTKDVNSFLRQLIMLLEAGTPILRSLRTMSERGERASVRNMVRDMTEFVEGGNPLWQAFQRHNCYSSVEVNLIKASEAAGTLVTVLARIVTFREKREMLRRRMIASLIYPVILVLVCIGVVLIIANWVLPAFNDLINKLGGDVPPFTQLFMNAVEFFSATWWLIGIILIGIYIAYKFAMVNSPIFRLNADRVKLRIPVLGKGLVQKNAIAQMTRTMGLLLRSGLPMMATLDLTRTSITNQAVAQTLQRVRDSVERGAGLEEPLRQASGAIPPVVTDMLVTGEEAGKVDVIAEQIADVYEEEVDIVVGTIGDLLTPVLIVFMGAIVLVVALAFFRPLIEMISAIQDGGA
jgi:type IV pilus assembly protein PilC